MEMPEGYSEGFVAALQTVKGMLDEGAPLHIVKEAVEEALESEQDE